MPHSPRRGSGFTLVEILTVLVVIVVLGALAIPMWRTHLLRVHRADGRDALIALQAAQDKFFGVHARYATAPEMTAAAPRGLGLEKTSSHGFYAIDLNASDDGLGYLATARALPAQRQTADARCAELSLDHNGRRRALDSSGADRSADCWH